MSGASRGVDTDPKYDCVPNSYGPSNSEGVWVPKGQKRDPKKDDLQEAQENEILNHGFPAEKKPSAPPKMVCWNGYASTKAL